MEDAPAKISLEAWNAAIAAHTDPLPGSIPYVNRRPIRVSERFSGLPLLEFLAARFPHVDAQRWRDAVAAGQVVHKGRAIGPIHRVRSGQELFHVLPGTVEPPVARGLTVIHDDGDLIAVEKPAPLPVHACGRYHRNTLVSFLEGGRPGVRLHIVHRLDADTTGLLVIALHPEAARSLFTQFAARDVEKRYLARVAPAPAADVFSCTLPLAPGLRNAGTRALAAEGASAHTDFRVLRRFADGSALLEVFPRTGRTHQIRLHLQALGHPIVGDAFYGAGAPPPGPFAGATPCLCLHAAELRLIHPRGGEARFRARAPAWAEPEHFPAAGG